MKLRLSLLAFLLAGGCAATSLPDQPQLKEFALPQTDFPLGSGLRVLVQEDHSSPLVVITTVFRVGGASDPKGVEGLAHFVEHLVFKSKFGGGKQMVQDILKRMGAFFNATTGPDMTTYYQIAHKDRLADLMQLEAWRLAMGLDGVTEAEFETEREIVRNELRQRRETNVGNRTFDELLVRLFPATHPLGHAMAGTHASLMNAKLEDARKFVAQHYRPANCTIVIAGDIKADEVKKQLGKWPAELLFGPGGPTGPKVPHDKLLVDSPAPEPPPPVSTALARLKGPVEQPLLLIGFSAPGGLRGKDMLLEFAGSALDTALGSGLFLKQDDDIRGVGGGAMPLADGSLFLIQAALKPGADPEKARTRILDAIASAWSTDDSRAAVSFEKWATATNLLRTSADPISSANAAAEELAITGETATYKRRLAELAALKANDVIDFAYKYLKRERAVSVFFEPETSGADATAGSGAGAAARSGHDLGRSDDTSIAGMGAPEIRRIARAPGVGALPRFKLSNGLQVVAIQRGSTPVAQIYLQIPGGDATTAPYGLASMATRLSRTKCNENGSLTPLGGGLSFGPSSLATRYTVQVLSGNLVNAVAVLSDQVACRDVLEESLLGLDELLKTAIDSQKERDKLPQSQAQKKLWSTLYPDHPYGVVEANLEQLKTLKFPEADAYVRAHFRPGNALAVVVSDTPAAELQPMMEKYFARWSGGGGARPQPPAPPSQPIPRAIHLFDRPGATQSSLSLGCRVQSFTPESMATFDVLGAVMDHKAEELREHWGATYGIQSGIRSYPGGTAHFALQGAVETAKTGAALEKLLTMIKDVGTQGPDIKSFTLKRWDLAREFDRNYATPNALAAAVLSTDLNGWPADTLDRYPERLAETTRNGVRDAIAPCAGHEVVTIIGDVKVVKPQLEKLGFKKWLAAP
jgi:zinc protease